MGLFCKKIGNLGDMMKKIIYFRYLTWFEVFLTNLELTHPGATRSMIPGSLSVVD